MTTPRSPRTEAEDWFGEHEALWRDPLPRTPEGQHLWRLFMLGKLGPSPSGIRDFGQRICQIEAEAAAPRSGEGLREAARAYLDAEAEPAYSWVIESQAARHEGRPNREVERMERVARARIALEEALAAGFTDGRGEPPERGTVTQCLLEGVHEHTFRGPHGFREWLAAAAPREASER